MLIRVKYVDDRFDMVRPEILARLLDAGKVREFQRDEGWVIPGIASMRRKQSRSGYSGVDRRKMWSEERRASE